MDRFVEFQDVCKYYQMGSQRIAAADHVSFEIARGEFTIIVGPSGAGKTTVLNMLGGMDACDEGTIRLDGNEISRYSRKQPPIRRGVRLPVLQSGPKPDRAGERGAGLRNLPGASGRP